MVLRGSKKDVEDDVREDGKILGVHYENIFQVLSIGSNGGVKEAR